MCVCGKYFVALFREGGKESMCLFVDLESQSWPSSRRMVVRKERDTHEYVCMKEAFVAPSAKGAELACLCSDLKGWLGHAHES